MKKLTYLNQIDSLRAIAVLLVVFFHLDISFFKGGFLGVDVFFVISGFLITRIINHEFSQTGTVSFKRFYLRRIRRLMPTLFLTIFLAFILTFLIFSPSDFINATKSMTMSSVALSNFHFLGESDYFDTASNFKPLLHTWSLGIEEQFYILYPITLFILIKCFKKRKNVVFFSLGILFSISLFLTLYTSEYGISDSFSNLFKPKDEITSSVASLQFYLLPFRMFEFLVGAIVALINKPKIKSEILKLFLNLVGLTTIISSAIILSKDSLYLSTLNLIPCLGAALLLFFPPSKYLAFVFENKALRYIGKISYTLYLVHWLLIVVYRYLFNGEFTSIETIGLFTFMLLLSSLIYHYYETPLRYRDYGLSIKSDKNLVFILVACILIVFVINLKVNSDDGWLWRLSPKNRELVENIGVPKDFHLNNWGGAGYKPGWIGEKPGHGGVPDIILMGDSHAGHYLYGLDSIMVKKNKKKIYISNWFTSLKLPDFVRSDKEGMPAISKNKFKQDLKIVNKYPESMVVLSHSWTSQINRSEVLDSETNEYLKLRQDTTGFVVIARKIEKFRSLIGKERKLLIIGASPKTKSNELNYIEKLLRPKYFSDLTPTSTTFKQNQIAFNTFFESYFKNIPDINFINPSPAFCSDGKCYKQFNEQIYFSDGSHLSRDGSLKAVTFFEDRLLNILDSKE
ncbi:acyltransferase family protein [Maribacter sp. 2-571]|uniref:acyltransferase family protein n=1 Tax=Maribacter sp. 2-571 TaxID=3417569 RepID=UPI003D3487F7